MFHFFRSFVMLYFLQSDNGVYRFKKKERRAEKKVLFNLSPFSLWYLVLNIKDKYKKNQTKRICKQNVSKKRWKGCVDWGNNTVVSFWLPVELSNGKVNFNSEKNCFEKQLQPLLVFFYNFNPCLCFIFIFTTSSKLLLLSK